jgi:hypothetical protein
LAIGVAEVVAEPEVGAHRFGLALALLVRARG